MYFSTEILLNRKLKFKHSVTTSGWSINYLSQGVLWIMETFKEVARKTASDSLRCVVQCWVGVGVELEIKEGVRAEIGVGLEACLFMQIS